MFDRFFFRFIRKAIFLLVLVQSMFSGAASANEVLGKCSDELGSCNYYLCREQWQNCGPDGYLMRLGYHYCSGMMKKVEPQLSLEGSRWLEKASRCLREDLDHLPLRSSCMNVERYGIASHYGCYIDTGFCGISMIDKLKILNYVKPELKDGRMLQLLMDILKACT